MDEIPKSNESFLIGTKYRNFNTKRSPGHYTILTCMDPRINLTAIGIDSINKSEEFSSQTRIIRTIGGMMEPRSIVVAKYLAGLKELVIMMHTDCGISLVYKNADALLVSIFNQLEPEKLRKFRSFNGEPFKSRLLDWLQAFEDPREAVKRQVRDLRNSFMIPGDLVIHGLLYDTPQRKDRSHSQWLYLKKFF